MEDLRFSTFFTLRVGRVITAGIYNMKILVIVLNPAPLWGMRTCPLRLQKDWFAGPVIKRKFLANFLQGLKMVLVCRVSKNARCVVAILLILP